MRKEKARFTKENSQDPRPVTFDEIALKTVIYHTLYHFPLLPSKTAAQGVDPSNLGPLLDFFPGLPIDTKQRFLFETGVDARMAN